MPFPISTKLFSALNPARLLPQRSDTPLVQRVKTCALAMIPIAAAGAGSYFAMHRTDISYDATKNPLPGGSTSPKGQAENSATDLAKWAIGAFVAIGIVAVIGGRVFFARQTTKESDESRVERNKRSLGAVPAYPVTDCHSKLLSVLLSQKDEMYRSALTKKHSSETTSHPVEPNTRGLGAELESTPYGVQINVGTGFGIGGSVVESNSHPADHTDPNSMRSSNEENNTLDHSNEQLREKLDYYFRSLSGTNGIQLLSSLIPLGTENYLGELCDFNKETLSLSSLNPTATVSRENASRETSLVDQSSERQLLNFRDLLTAQD